MVDSKKEFVGFGDFQFCGSRQPRQSGKSDVQLVSHGDVPAAVDPALSQNVGGDPMLEPLECVTPAQFDVFVGGVAMGVRHDLGKGQMTGGSNDKN